MQIVLGLVFICCGVASVIGLYARIESWWKGWKWDVDDGSLLLACIVGALLSGARLLTYITHN